MESKKIARIFLIATLITLILAMGSCTTRSAGKQTFVPHYSYPAPAQHKATISGMASVESTQTCTKPLSNLIIWLTGDNTANDLYGIYDSHSDAKSMHYREGKVGQAFLFDGNYEYLFSTTMPRDMSSLDMGDTGDSFSAWIYPHNTQGKKQRIMAQYEDPDAWALSVTDNTLDIIIGGRTSLSYTGSIIDKWSLVNLVFDYPNSKALFYVNGEKVDEKPYTIPPKRLGYPLLPAPKGMKFGYYVLPNAQTSYYSYNGLIDEFQVYDTALPPSEIQRIYSSTGSASSCKNPPVMFQFVNPTDTGGSRTGDEYCQKVGSRCLDEEWTYRSGLSSRGACKSGGWCTPEEPGGAVTLRGCKERIDSTVFLKRVRCSPIPSPSLDAIITFDTTIPYATGPNGEGFCQAKGGICVATDWLAKSDCPKGYCPPDTLGATQEEWDCKITGASYPNSAVRVLCKGVGSTPPPQTKSLIYQLIKVADAAGATDANDFCKKKGGTCTGVDWLYKPNKNDGSAWCQPTGWCGPNTAGAQVKTYPCNELIANPTWEGMEKQVHCTITGSASADAITPIDTVIPYTPGPNGDGYCQDKKGTCIATQWFAKTTCPKGYCPPNTPDTTTEQWGCKVTGEGYANSAIRVLCKGAGSVTPPPTPPTPPPQTKSLIYQLIKVADAAGATDANDFCKKKGGTCTGVDWLYKPNKNDGSAWCQPTGWCGPNTAGAQVKTYPCNELIANPTWEGMEKQVHCTITGSASADAITPIDTVIPYTPGPNGDGYCQDKKGTCIATQWFAKTTCPKGYCPPNTPDTTTEQWGCKVTGEGYANSAIRVLCKGLP